MIPQDLRHYFWDVNPLALDIEHNKRFIVERILEKGDVNATQWLKQN